jgi:hypothetical protein
MESETSSPASSVVPPPLPAGPLPPDIPPASRLIHFQRRHGRSQQGYYEHHFRRGRIWVAVLFCVFRLAEFLEALPYLAAPEFNTLVKIALVWSVIWSTALLAATWLRQGWARLGLVVLATAFLGIKAYHIVQTVVLAPELVSGPTLILPGCLALIYTGIIYVLVRVKALRRLTNRSYV